MGVVRRKSILENAPSEGRLDVLAFRLAESTVKLAETKIGVRLWDLVKTDIEDLIRGNIPSSPDHVKCPEFDFLKTLIQAQRKKGGM